ncbi:MAG: hypothetical protein QMD12_03230 [Candidatus Aenigmarchaeota archaeon]|nr:hypothetical protein [Candidatus Aenigmarchaeota archaeon]
MIIKLRRKEQVPTIFIDEESKKFLESLRRKIPAEKVPTLKSTAELVLRFLKLREKEFVEWAKESTKA